MEKNCNNCNHEHICVSTALHLLPKIPCSDWQPRYTGKWTKTKNGFKCSECGEEAAAQFSYCPDCGADMMYEVL